MKKFFTLAILLSVMISNAQAFKGNGDLKGQVGAVIQSGATGIAASADFGLGENMSYGFVASYLLYFVSELRIKFRKCFFNIKLKFEKPYRICFECVFKQFS